MRIHATCMITQVFVLYVKAELENVARLKLKAQSFCISVSCRMPSRVACVRVACRCPFMVHA